MRWIEKRLHLLELSRRSLSACKVWGDGTKRAGCKSENWCFLYVTLGLPVRGGTQFKQVCVTVYGSILMRFSTLFFRMYCSFRFSFSSRDGATYFAKLQSKIAKSPKIGGKI